MRPWVGLSMMVEPEFMQAAYPLFLNGEVEMLEWSFDVVKEKHQAPDWLQKLLKEYSKKGRLVGHGVRYSMLSGKWTSRHEKWLSYLKREIKKNSYRYFTEHFGFMSSSDFHKGAPLPVPMNEQTLLMGQDRLKRLQSATHLAVGLENLAFAFNAEDVKKHGTFLEKLIEPVNGFIILDLHNVWCQAVNFNMDVLKLIRSYPLDKVRELHISGGSWSPSDHLKDAKPVRRDTHDEAVPEELFKVLPKVLALCKNIECIVFERLGDTIKNTEEAEQFRKDFLRIKKIVADEKRNEKYPSEKIKNVNSKYKLSKLPLSNTQISKQQKLLVKTLTESKDPFAAMKLLKNENSLNDWSVSQWPMQMLETSMKLIDKWNG